MGFFAALTLLFIALKATGVISLSWWWAVTPAVVWFLIVVSILVLAYKNPLLFIDKSKFR